MVMHFLCIQKKDWPIDPPDFWAKRANKPFIFLGLIKDITSDSASQLSSLCMYFAVKTAIIGHLIALVNESLFHLVFS